MGEAVARQRSKPGAGSDGDAELEEDDAKGIKDGRFGRELSRRFFPK
jgi:hypothetical protein